MPASRRLISNRKRGIVMLEKIKKSFIGVFAFAATWFLLSYLFFPVRLFAPPAEYFVATVTHMMPLKCVISIIFTLLAVFMYEQFEKKKSGKTDNISK